MTDIKLNQEDSTTIQDTKKDNWVITFTAFHWVFGFGYLVQLGKIFV